MTGRLDRSGGRTPSFLASRRGAPFRALRHPEFRVVWPAFLVGQLGFWISFISFQALMARLTGGDGSWLGLLFFVNFAPMLIFTPVAGVVTDRLDRKLILVVGYIVLAALMTVLAVMTLADDITPARMLPFAFAIGTVFAFNAPAGQAIVANAVPSDDLASAVSLQSVGANLSRVAGPTLAAPVLAFWNEGAAFLAYAAASLVVVVLMSRIDLSSYEPEDDGAGFWKRLGSGLAHARERPPALDAIVLLCMSSLFATGYLAVLPVLADRVYDRGPTGFTALAAMTGVGSILGALSTGFRDSVPTLRTSARLVAGFGGSLVAFAYSPTWAVALCLVAVVGFFYFGAMTRINTLLQAISDDNKRGRVMSLFLVGWAGLVPIAGLWQGALSEVVGVRSTIALAGTVTAVYALTASGLLRGRGQPTPR